MRSAVVLYGGSSVRMGADKGMQVLGGKPLIYWVLESVSKNVDEIIISISRRNDLQKIDFSGDIALVPDERAGLGPIGGLLSGMKRCRGEYAAVAPVDAPLINPKLTDLLFERIRGHDAAVPRIRGFWEPLIAVYRCDAMLHAIDRTLEDGTRDIRSTFPHMDVIEVDQDEIEIFDPYLLSFTNINTTRDLEKLNSSLNTG